MSAKAIEIADAIVAKLKAVDAAGNILPVDRNATRMTFANVTRAWRAISDLADMGANVGVVYVTAIPTTLDEELLGRSNGRRDDHTIDLAIQAKLPESPDDDKAIDDLMALVDVVRSKDVLAVPTDLAGARLIRVQAIPAFSAVHLKDFRQFTSVLRLTYRVAI